MKNSLSKRIKQYPNLLPTVLDYSNFLKQICKKEKINMEQARNKYGQFDYKQLSEILK